MATQLTAADARQSLQAHVAAKGAEIFETYGPHIGEAELRLILLNRELVRYPCELSFDSSKLESGELAYPVPHGEHPGAGFTMCVHPALEHRPEDVAAVVFYQLVLVNYGVFAGPEDAETFGAAALGTGRDEYYARLCALADELPGGIASPCHQENCG